MFTNFGINKLTFLRQVPQVATNLVLGVAFFIIYTYTMADLFSNPVSSPVNLWGNQQTSGSSSQLKTPDQQMWYFGGNQQGPAPQTNPVRQAVGNFVEGVGNAIPGLGEGYVSELIAGGPTRNTAAYASEPRSGTSGYQQLPTGQEPAQQPQQQQQPQDNSNSDLINALINKGGYNAIDAANAANGDNAANLMREFLGTGGPDQNQIRNEISSGWDQYINSLNDQIGGLQTQRGAQEGTIGAQYGQGVNQLDLQKQQGLQDLDKQRVSAEQNQVKNLRDISGNIKNSFMAGNNYLGSMGAGDSSAANQYAFALTKMGTQQRSDVMQNTANITNDISGRETNLNNVYNSEVNNLGFERDQALQGVAKWFADAQGQVKQMQAQGQLNKSQDLASLSKDIYNQALKQLDDVNSYARDKQAALEQWAINQSTNINQVKQNLAAVSNVSYNQPQAQGIVGSPTVDSSGNMVTPRFFGGANTSDKLFQ